VTTITGDWPIFWEKASGWTVTDVDGNDYIDFTSAFGVANVGHANPKVVSAVQSQAATLMHGMGDVHPPSVKVKLLEALAGVCPESMDYAILGLNGGDAIEAALKCAAIVTGKPGVIAFTGGYHGLTGGALSVTARRDFRDPFGARLSSLTTFARYPRTDAEMQAVISELEHRLQSKSSGLLPTGALIVEPIQGRGGVVVPPVGWLSALRTLCDRHGIMMIVDEIFTGFGRTGDWFGIQHENVTPDLLCVGKGLGGGMPISACIGHAQSLGQWPVASGEALHTATFLGHPVSCAAALAALEVTKRENLPERARKLGEHMCERLTHADIGKVRGRGAMYGLELDGGSRAFEVVTRALDRGLLLLPSGDDGQVISLTPPLIMEEQAIDNALDVLIECVRAT
jgi:4-aminobutyrate aminotransferase-like enzyme